MNIFQKQMLNDINFHKSIREQNAKQREVEHLTGQKFPCIFKRQAGFPLEDSKCQNASL